MANLGYVMLSAHHPKLCKNLSQKQSAPKLNPKSLLVFSLLALQFKTRSCADHSRDF